MTKAKQNDASGTDRKRPAATSGEVPTRLHISRAADGRYLAHCDGKTTPVRVVSCFPWTAPGTYISLRDTDDREIALIPSLNALAPESRAVLEHALHEAAFAFEIVRVDSIRRAFELRHWEVTCASGPRVFQTRVDDWPRHLPPHGLLVTDVYGDVYSVPDWTQLDKHSRKQLAMYID